MDPSDLCRASRPDSEGEVMNRITVNDLIVSNIRTQSPILVGLALSWIAMRLGIIIDEGTSTAVASLFTAVVSGVYYAVARYLESISPAFGWLLGRPTEPSYPDVKAPPNNRSHPA